MESRNKNMQLKKNGTARASHVADLPVVMSALASELRRSILIDLTHGPADVSTIAENVDAQMSLVSRNLSQLRDAGLVISRKDARHRIYEIAEGVEIGLTRRQITISVLAGDGQRVILEMKRR